MKKLLTLIAVAAMALTAIPAFAAVDSTPHDYVGKTETIGSLIVGGRCGTCHVPHAASTSTAKRLWPTNVAIVADDGSSWGVAVTGALCGDCHLDPAVRTTQNAALQAPHKNALIFAATSHGRTMATLGAGAGNLGDSGVNGTYNNKPYMANAYIQCTSCHNAHDDTMRPFLRAGLNNAATMSGFCADCHNNRYNATVSAGGNASGNHPVNVNFTDNAANGAGYFVPTGSLPSALTGGVASGAWSLGGKFEGGAAPAANVAIGCQTCHAVHSPAAAGNYRQLYLLAMNNNTVNTAALCNGCHGDPNGNTARANSGATMQVGQTDGDHPIDCAITTADGGPAMDLWYTTAGSTVKAERVPAGQPTYWSRAANGNIICTSCHSAHRAIANGFLKRTGGNASWCLSCHSDASPAGHHSHSGNSTSTLTCESCHGSGTGNTGAHNGFSFNSGWNTVATNANSELCNMCHINVTTTGGPTALQALRDPVGNISGYGGLSLAGVGANAAFHLSGTPNNVAQKSHYIGAFTNSAHDINAKTSTWRTDIAAFSKYGDASDTHGAVAATSVNKMVCESCHAITKNIGCGNAGANSVSGWQNNLLLQDYKDDSDNVGGSRSVKSDFCLACHNQGNLGNPDGPLALPAPTKAQAPAGIHPLTGFTITRAVDAGRSPSTLITAATGYASAGTAPTAAGGIGSGIGLSTSYPGTDEMDCDSCHRPHKANTNATFNRTITKPTETIPVITEYWGSTANEYGEFCQACHAM